MDLSRLNWFRRPASHVVVDIGSSSVKLATVTPGSCGQSISEATTVPLPPGTVQNGWIRDRATVVGAIEEYTRGGRLTAAAAVTAIPGRTVMIKTLEFPIMNIMDLETTIEFHAMEVVPENLDNVLLDYQVTGETKEKKQLTVLLTAAKKELVGSYMEVLSEAGLIPRIVDVDYFALQNLCQRLHANSDDQVVCVMHIGASVTTLHIMSKGLPLFSRDLETAGQFFTERLSHDRGISSEEAERIKLRDRLSSGANEDLIPALCDDFANELKREMSLFAAMNGEQQIDRLYVCGGGAKLPGLQTTLAEKFNDRVGRCEPLFDGAADAGDSTNALPPEFAVVGGLAMRKPWEP